MSNPIRIGMIGLGTVGSGVAKLLKANAQQYALRTGTTLELVGVLVRDTEKAMMTGLVDQAILTNDPDAFFAQEMDVVLEVAGGVEVAGNFVRRAIEKKCHVVTANKALLAAQGPELYTLAKQNQVSIAFEASCGGGIPIITALSFGLMSNRIDALYGILNGTCNYILTEMVQKGKTYADALAEAKELGYAEADETLDVSGADAAQKLVVLSSLAFDVKVTEDQIALKGIDTLDLSDVNFGSEMGYEIKLLAMAQQTDAGLSLRTMPCFINKETQLAQVDSSFNALSVYGSATGHTFYYGRGAGELPTASAVVSDLLNIVSGWYPKAFEQMNIWPVTHPDVQLADPAELIGRFYLRVDVQDVPGVMAKLTSALGNAGISINAVMQHETEDEQTAPVVILTHEAKQGDVQTALAEIAALPDTVGTPVILPVVDFPAG
ncbi:MAG: homoserine dehydrogenase [Phycisphaeraceae bacterium]|nr:homoserine dehydrogenase [Phycisphaeraceae bacterium]